MRTHGGFTSAVEATLVVVPLLVFLALAFAACGGSDTTANSSPGAASSPSSASPENATPLPAPTVAGTIAFTRTLEPGLAHDIYVINADGTGLKQLTDDLGVEQHPSWSPDGTRIIYDAGTGDLFSTSIWVMNADGSGKAKLTKGYHPHWSPDGKRIVFNRYFGDARGEDVFVMDADGSGVRLVSGQAPSDTDPSWASDERIVATVGRDVFAMNLDGSGRVRLTKGEDVQDSAASPDGTMLAYHDLDGDRVVVVPLRRTGSTVTLLEPVTDIIIGNLEAAFAWAPDGKALAVASNDGGGPDGSPLYIVNADGTGLSAVPGIEDAMDPAWRPE